MTVSCGRLTCRLAYIDHSLSAPLTGCRDSIMSLDSYTEVEGPIQRVRLGIVEISQWESKLTVEKINYIYVIGMSHEKNIRKKICTDLFYNFVSNFLRKVNRSYITDFGVFQDSIKNINYI